MIDAFAFGVAPVSFSHGPSKPVGEQRVHGGEGHRRRRSSADGSSSKSRARRTAAPSTQQQQQQQQQQHTASRRHHWYRRRDSLVIIAPEGNSSKAAPEGRLVDAQQHHGDAYAMVVAHMQQQPASSAVAIASPFAAREVQLARSLSRCCSTPRNQQARRLLGRARQCVAKSMMAMWHGLAFAHVLSPIPGAGGMALQSHY